MKNKVIVTVTGIRPEFIRMSEVFKKFDKNFTHVMIHTGQHYEYMLSDVFFQNMQIRSPDTNLHIGNPELSSYQYTGMMATKVIETLNREKINPDLVLFLGDSNTVSIAPLLKREGYKIGHIEAGMRCGYEWMPEEIYRKGCDHVSNCLYAYTELNERNLLNENIDRDRIHVVGNTIVEVCKPYVDKLKKIEKRKDFILMDIHRHENLIDVNRLKNIIEYANKKLPNLPIKMLKFSRTLNVIEKNKLKLGRIELVDLMSYKDFLSEQYHSYFIFSDSGSAQEEAPLFGTPVVVPRNHTERPQSMWFGNSKMLNFDSVPERVDDFVENYYNKKVETAWLGDGKTSEKIVTNLKERLDD